MGSGSSSGGGGGGGSSVPAGYPDPGKITSFFKELSRRFKLLGMGIKDIFEGLKVAVTAVCVAAKVGIHDIGLLVEYIFNFTEDSFTCFKQFLYNLKYCFLFYVIEMCGQILYFPIRVLVWTLKKFIHFDMQPYLDTFWAWMEKIDRIFYSYASFHLIHYPHEVRQHCYVCKRLSERPVSRQGHTVKYDWREDPSGNDPRLLQIIKGKFAQFMKGEDELKQATAPW